VTLPAYPAARSVAARVQAHFIRHLAAARDAGRTDLAPVPDAVAIEALIDAAFWASLRREEGAATTVSMAYLAPEHAGLAMKFEADLPLTPAALARLAPAVERPGIHLGVWRIGPELRIWGTTRRLPAFGFVIEVVASGLLVVKQRSEPFGKFVNVAVLEGDQIKIIDERGASVPDCPGMLQSLLGFDFTGARGEAVNVLVLLAASMRRHGKGGTLLIVPSNDGAWRESIVLPMLYAVDPPFNELADLMRQSVELRTRDWQDQLLHAVDGIGVLTAVDGAAIIRDTYEVLAFGAKITPRLGQAVADRVIVTEPIEGSITTAAAPTQLGGTRHLSAVQFVHDQHDTTALVASQDGRFTIFKWSPREDMVHAHRVEALLL
jgi:hypothetical protein